MIIYMVACSEQGTKYAGGSASASIQQRAHAQLGVSVWCKITAGIEQKLQSDVHKLLKAKDEKMLESMHTRNPNP